MQEVTKQKNGNEPKTPKTAKEKTIFGLKIAGNVLFYLIILFLLLFSIMNINAGSKNQGFPNIFGKGFLSVQSDSMSRSESGKDPEEWKDYKIGGFNKGDLLLVDVFNKKDCSSLHVGDVITFYSQDLEALNTHRIVYIFEDSKSVITQGDQRAQLQPFDKDEPFSEYNGKLSFERATELVSVENIKGVVTGVNTGAGKVLDNIHQNWLWYFVLPIALFLIFEIFMVAKNVLDLRAEKQKAAGTEDLQSQKEALRAQILAELQEEAKRNQVALESEKNEVIQPLPTEEDSALKAESVETPAEEPTEESVSEKPSTENANPSVDEPNLTTEKSNPEAQQEEAPSQPEAAKPVKPKKTTSKSTTGSSKTTASKAKSSQTKKTASTKSTGTSKTTVSRPKSSQPKKTTPKGTNKTSE